MKKSLLIFLCALMCLFAFSAGICAAAPVPWDGSVDTSWYDAEKVSFEINSPQQLAGLAAIVNGTAEGVEKDNFDGKSVTLTAALDMGGVKGADGTWSGQSWTPIGNSTSVTFRGTFNANGKEISNLYINSENDYVGLFGAIDSNALVKNLILASGSVASSGSYVGGITGYMSGKAIIYNCGSYADVTGADYVGGIAGRMNGTTVQVYKVFNAGDVKTSKNGGGIVGYVQAAISNVYNTGDVTNVGTNAAAPVGGIAGTATNAVKFTNCYSSGKVTSIEGASNHGLMVGLGWVRMGMLRYCTFTNCYYEKSVDGMFAVGGDTSERTGTVGKSAAEMKGIASALGSEFAADDEKAPVNNGNPILAWQVKKANGSYSFVENWGDYAAASYAAGDGTYENPYEISNAQELALLIKDAKANKTTGIYYKQTADIDLSGYVWDGISTFCGNYDGGNHVVDHLYVNTTASNIGLFGNVSSGDIMNVKMTNVDIRGGSYVGALIGYSNGADIANCHVLSGTVTGGSSVGGLIGIFYPVGSTNQILAPDYIMDSSASVDVTAGSWCGGLVGAVNNGVVSTQTGTGRKGNVLIENCYATGDVNITAAAGTGGGLLGSNGPVKKLLIENCYASGKVTAPENSTGVVGGLVGSSGFGTIGISDDALYTNNVVLSAEISGTNETAPAGRITGLGQNKESTLVTALENNYAIDTMTVSGAVVTNGDADSYHGASLSAEELEQQATWEKIGFDFSSTGSWKWDEASKRPVLKGTALKSYPIVIKTQPHDATAYLNRDVLFRAEAGKGTGDLSYAWQMSSDQGKTWKEVGTGTELICKGRLSWDGNLIRCCIRDSKRTFTYTDTVVINVVESDYTATVAANELYSLYQQDIVSTAKAPTALYGISGDISDLDILLYYRDHYDVNSVLTGRGMRPWAAIDWMAQGNDPTAYLLTGETTVNAEETDLIASYLQMQNELGTGAFTNENGTSDKDWLVSNLYYFLALDIYYQGADTWGNENEEGTTGRDAAIEYLLSLVQTDAKTGYQYYYKNVINFNYIRYGLDTAPLTRNAYISDFVTVMSRLADDPVYGKRVRSIIYDSMDCLADNFANDGATKSNTMCSAKYLSALVAAANIANSDTLVKAYTEQMEVVFDNILKARAFDGTYSLLTDEKYYKTGEILPEKTGLADTTAAVAMAFGDYANGYAVLTEMNYERAESEMLNFDMNQIEIPSVVLSDIELPASGFNGTVFTWSSSNENVISVGGKVSRPEEDTVVSLTVKGVLGAAEMERSFTVTVSADRGEGGDAVYADAENISLLPEYIYDIALPGEGANGSVITWASSDEAVIAPDGKVTRPAIGEKDAMVTLTATVTKGDISETRAFAIKVWANVDTATNEGMVKEAYYQIRYGCMNKKALSTYWDVWTTCAALGEDLDKFDLVYDPASTGTSLGGRILAIISMGDNPYNCNGKNYIKMLEQEGFNASWSEPVFRMMAAEAAGMDDPRINIGSSISWLNDISHGTDIAGWACVPVSRHVDDNEKNREITQNFIDMISETMSGPTADTTVSLGCVVSGLSAFYAAGLEFEGIEGLDVTRDEPWVSMNAVPNLYKYIEGSFGSSASGFGGQITMELADLYNTLYKDGNVIWISCGVTKAKLDDQIEKANAILKDKEHYTEASIKAIEDALKAVNDIPEADLNAKIPTWGETYYTLYDAVRYAKTTNAPVVDEAALQAAKDAAVKEVEEAFVAYDSDDYSATNWDKLVGEKDRGLLVIRNAENEAAVAAGKEAVLAGMAAVPASSADGAKIEVSFRLIGATRATADIDFSEAPGEYHGSEYQNWIKTTTYQVDQGACVYDVLVKALKEHGMTQTGGSDGYVSAITAPAVLGGESLGEFDNGPNSGWMYTINGLHPSFGVKEMILNDGDVLVFHYVNDFKYEDESTNPTSEYLNKWLEAPDVEPGEDEVTIVDPSELPFKDLTDNWYKQAVAYVYSYKLMNGTSATAFEPQTTLNRAMMATILYRIEGEPAVTAKNPFGDVQNDANGSWYYNAVLWASQNGIVKGYEDDTFRPVREITREEMAVMMYRYAEYKGMDMTATADFAKFSDGATVNEWAKPAMSWAVGVNLITGHDNGTLEPQGTATRAQAATVLMRFNELMK